MREKFMSSSFPMQLTTLIAGVVISPPECCSSKLRKACDENAAELTGISDQLAKAIEELSTAIDTADASDDWSSVAAAAENLKLDKAQLAQRAVRACSVAVELAEQAVEELKAIPGKLEAEAEQTVATVKQELTAIGCGLEAMPAFGLNAPASERQFEHLARFQNLRSKAAIAKAEDARARHKAATAAVHARKRKLTAAQAFIRDLAQKSLNS
jgi:hypothetical protein